MKEAVGVSLVSSIENINHQVKRFQMSPEDVFSVVIPYAG